METLGKYSAKLRDSGQVTLPPKETKPYYLPFQHAHEMMEVSIGQSLEPMGSGFVFYPDGTKKLVKNPYEGYMLTLGANSHNSPDKPIKEEPQPPQTPSLAASPAISSGGTTNNTPAMASATLKRKSEATSPVIGNPDSSAANGSKPRVPRKRNRTQPS